MSRLILLTRPRAESESLAARLGTMGLESFIEPMLEIRPLDPPLPDFSDIQALVFTSANAVRTFHVPKMAKNIKTYVVGKATADCAESYGFCKIKEGGGTIDRLNLFLREEDLLRNKKVLHVCGADRAGDVVIPGLCTDRLEVYSADKAQALSRECLQLLDEGRIGSIPFFSVRTAETFVSLLKKHGRTEKIIAVEALCISDKVLDCFGQLDFKCVRVSRTPDVDGVVSLLSSSTGAWA